MFSSTTKTTLTSYLSPFCLESTILSTILTDLSNFTIMFEKSSLDALSIASFLSKLLFFSFT